MCLHIKVTIERQLPCLDVSGHYQQDDGCNRTKKFLTVTFRCAFVMTPLQMFRGLSEYCGFNMNWVI